MTKDGAVEGHIASVVWEYVSPLSLLQQRWWVWYVVVWADGTQEKTTWDWEPWSVVKNMREGSFEFSSRESPHNGRYEFAWLDPAEAVAAKEKLGIKHEDF